MTKYPAPVGQFQRGGAQHWSAIPLKSGLGNQRKIEMSVISVRSEKRKHGKCCHPTKPPLCSLPVNSPSLNGYMAYQACQEGLFFPFIFNFGYLHVFAFYETGAVQSLAFGVLR
jgi:hypothetical protein